MSDEQGLTESVAAYVEELNQPGIPIVSTSHIVLYRLYALYGEKAVDAEIAKQFGENKRGEQ